MEGEAATTNYDGTVYKLLCNDGHYYIGSTKSELKYRLYHHKQHSVAYPERKVYSYILTIGWDNVKIVSVEQVSCSSREELLKKENEYIKNALSDPLCLNTNKAHLTKEELLQDQKEYVQANKEKVDAYQANYRRENAEERCEYSRKYAAEHPEQVRAARKAHYQENKTEIIEKQKAYAEANKEAIQKRKKEYAQANKDKISEARKQYAEANKEVIQERGKKYYEANKDVIQEKFKAYREANKDKMRKLEKGYREKNKDKLSESHTCDCGGKYTITHRKIHIDSKRHKKFLENSRAPDVLQAPDALQASIKRDALQASAREAHEIRADAEASTLARRSTDARADNI